MVVGQNGRVVVVALQEFSDGLRSRDGIGEGWVGGISGFSIVPHFTVSTHNNIVKYHKCDNMVN